MELTTDETNLLLESLMDCIIVDQDYIINACKNIQDYNVITGLIAPKEARIAASKELIKKLKG